MRTNNNIPRPNSNNEFVTEQIQYNYIDGTINWGSTFRHMYPLPNEYKEVEYIQNGQYDCIVLDDLLLYHNQSFGVRCKMMVKVRGAFLGAGHDVGSGSNYTYGLSLWLYDGSDDGISNPNVYFWGARSDGGMQVIIPENQLNSLLIYEAEPGEVITILDEEGENKS